jgi:NAD(P)-dependent dehydrogenase (short-subunit alcohol dehydrogenase family)
METVVITGANRGIGLEMARRYAERGDKVIAVCRQSSDGLDGLDAEVITGIDVGDDESLARLSSIMEGKTIDRLVNNAGILEKSALDSLDRDSIERQFRINAMSPLFLTRALRPSLGNGSRVFIITSRMGSIDDNDSGGSYGYRMSKAAVNIAGKSLSVDLKDDGIAVFLLHPGWVSTDMTGHTGIAVEDSAAGLVSCMDALDMSMTGTFWHQEGYELPW